MLMTLMIGSNLTFFHPAISFADDDPYSDNNASTIQPDVNSQKKPLKPNFKIAPDGKIYNVNTKEGAMAFYLALQKAANVDFSDDLKARNAADRKQAEEDKKAFQEKLRREQQSDYADKPPSVDGDGSSPSGGGDSGDSGDDGGYTDTRTMDTDAVFMRVIKQLSPEARKRITGTKNKGLQYAVWSCAKQFEPEHAAKLISDVVKISKGVSDDQLIENIFDIRSSAFSTGAYGKFSDRVGEQTLSANELDVATRLSGGESVSFDSLEESTGGERDRLPRWC